jgi:hypothetical protein
MTPNNNIRAYLGRLFDGEKDALSNVIIGSTTWSFRYEAKKLNDEHFRSVGGAHRVVINSLKNKLTPDLDGASEHS